MPLDNTLQVRGLRELMGALRQSAPDLARAMRRELKQVVQPAVLAARGYAPAGDALAASIHVKTRAGGRAPGVVVGSPLLHAPIIEFGRQAVVSGGKVAAHVRTLTPHRYLIPAVDATAARIEADVTDVVQHTLDQLFDGTEARA